MAQEAASGPIGTYGDMNNLPASIFGAPSGPVPDPNTDAGPSFFFQWAYMPDCRFIYPKDQVTGGRGRVAGFMDGIEFKSVGQIPCAFGTANISSVAGVTSGVALAFAASSLGVTTNVPITPFNGELNGQVPVTAAVALDFGYAFGNCTAASATITVSNSNLFTIGMPLVIGGVGNSAGTVPLLTQVIGLPSATTITVQNAPLASNSTAPIGTGNLWSTTGSTGSGQPLIPTAATPYLAAGPGLLFDPAQAVTRGLQIVGASGGSGGTMTVHGWDIFGVPMSETITVGAGAVTGWGKKAFKYIGSIVPNFTDSSHAYTVGTSDVFGFNLDAPLWELTSEFWAGAHIVGTPTGFLGGVTTAATATTGDVRGTFQASAQGGGTGSGSTNSNGSVSSLAMSGNRLELFSRPSLRQIVYAKQSNSTLLYGVTQA